MPTWPFPLRPPLIAASILVVIALLGSRLLHHLGDRHPVLQIAGGLLLFGASYQVIFRDRAPSRPYRKCRALARPRHAARGLFGQFVINRVTAHQAGLP